MSKADEILKLLKERQSTRVPYDPDRPILKNDLKMILEAGSWAPTAHNMQNYEIVVVDDKKVLDKIGAIKSGMSLTFLRENYEQLSFSKEELMKKKTGILGTMFPPEWRDPSKMEDVVKKTTPGPIIQRINGCPTLLVILYDSRKRAPASEGDVLGFMSLGCVMQNMWLMAHSLGLGYQILSALSADPVAEEIKKILKIPDYMNIAYTVRIGYPKSEPNNYIRVRRDYEDFVHMNIY